MASAQPTAGCRRRRAPTWDEVALAKASEAVQVRPLRDDVETVDVVCLVEELEAYCLGCVCAMLGETKAALRHLKRALERAR